MPSTTETDAPMRPTALAAGPLVPTVDSQRPLAPCHDASTGTKLSQHATLAAPTGTKLSQHATLAAPTGTKLSQHARNTSFRRILHQQGELCTASTTTKPSRANFLPHTEPPTVQNSPSTQPSRPQPVQNSPDTRPRRAIPVQNSPDTRPRRPQPVQNSPSMPETPLFGAFCASRENFVPLPPPPSRAGRKKSRTGRAKRGGASPYNPRNALIAGISRTAWTRPAR